MRKQMRMRMLSQALTQTQAQALTPAANPPTRDPQNANSFPLQVIFHRAKTAFKYIVDKLALFALCPMKRSVHQ
jgi:hypothetical protein